MNEHELEQRLRGWYRAEIDEGPAPSPSLRAAVDAIPASAPASRASIPRRSLLMAATFAVVGVAGAIAIGSNLAMPPTEPPNLPSPLAEASPAATQLASVTPVPSPVGLASPVPFEPRFHAVGEMATPRFQHTATLLDDGRVLVAGGRSIAAGTLGSTEIWESTTGSFNAGPPMVVDRFGHTATRLPDGRVAIIGGLTSGGRGTKEVELWDPSTNTFRRAGATVLARGVALSTVLLRDGQILIIGGGTCDPPLGPAPTPNVGARLRCHDEALNTEIWDPATETSRLAGKLLEEQDWGAATILEDGRVFVLGGGHLPTLGAEVWDPATETWLAGGVPLEHRLGGQSVTLLRDGSVAVIGGYTGTLESDAVPLLASIEVWDPSTQVYVPAGQLAIGRERHEAVLLADGRILVVGGFGDYDPDLSQTPFAEAEVWDPATGTTSSAGQAATGRGHHTMTLLSDRRVLITGGVTRSSDGEPVADTPSAEIWAP